MASVGNCIICGLAVDDAADRVVVVANRFRQLTKNQVIAGFPKAESTAIYRIGWLPDIHYHVACCPPAFLPPVRV